MDYGRAIRLVRSARRMSQAELAEHIECASSFVSLLENNQRDPSLQTLEAIADAFGIPTYLLLLLASEPSDLDGIGEEQAQVLGKQLLDILVSNDQANSS